MNRGVMLLGAGALVVMGTAVWLVFATHAAIGTKDAVPVAPRPEVREPPVPVTESAPVVPPRPIAPIAPRPMAPPPPPMPAFAPAPRERVTTPLDVPFDEARLRRAAHPLSEPTITQIRGSFTESQQIARDRLAAGRSPEEVLAPVRGARRFLREELSATEPADTLRTALGFFDELEREALLRTNPPGTGSQ